MEIVISQQAINWFKEDIGVKAGDKVRFYVQFMVLALFKRAIH